MKLYTSSNAVINAIKIDSLDSVKETPAKWTVTNLSIDGIPIVAYFKPTQKKSQYRFQWANSWYRFSAAEMHALPTNEWMIFYTKPTEATTSIAYNPPYLVSSTSESKEAVAAGPFITIVQVPDVKGLFVGTILRAVSTPSKDNSVNCIFRGQEITLTSDFYRLAEPSEIMSYFYMHSGGAIWVQSGPHTSGFLATIKSVNGTDVVYKTYQGIKAVAESGDHVIHINYVFLPTREQVLNYKIQEAKRDGFEIGTTANAPILGEVIIQSFSIDITNKLIATVGRPGNPNPEKMVPIESLSVVRETWNVSDGVVLATQVIASIPNIDSSFIAAKVKEDFLETLRSWCDNKLKILLK